MVVSLKLRSHLIKDMVFPLMEMVKGNQIRHYIQELQSSQYWSADKLNAYRAEKLKKLLLFAVSHVPVYQNKHLLMDMIELDPIAALRKFPILTKDYFNKHRDLFISQQADRQNVIVNRTGGSTGEPVMFYMDRYTVEHYEAARWRGLSWHNIAPGDPSVMIWGSPIELSQKDNKKYALKELWLKNRITVSAYELTKATIRDDLDRMIRFKPDYLYGYASALYILAKLIRENHMPFHLSLKGVISTAETLHEYQRKLIEDVFDCPVINEYGARDGGIIAYQCPQGNMHVQAENLWIEILDIRTQQPVQPGQDGMIVITDLNNFVMPRLRYQIGDLGALSSDFCACGIRLPFLQNILGRTEELFVTANGTFVHGHYFHHLARGLERIKQFQIIQHDLASVTVKVVPQISGTHEDIIIFADKIKEKMAGAKVDIEIVEEIPLSASGKVRSVIREFMIS